MRVPDARMITLEPGGRIAPVKTPMAAPESRCPHQQAEPVILSTGETVACVCIACFQALSANWISSQVRRAEVAAHCSHDDLVEIAEFGKEPSDWDHLCTVCGAWNP